jgi:hypothetical protein
MRLTRRDWFRIAAFNACAAAAARRAGAAQERPVAERRAAEIILEFQQQGWHRTGTTVDFQSSRWLADKVRAAGLDPDFEPFPLQRVDVATATLTAGDRRVDGIPLFDGSFTDAAGITGRIGVPGTDADIALVETAVNAASAGALGDARRSGRHRAIVAVTRGRRVGLCPSNADAFAKPFGPPVLQVSSEHAEWLAALASQRAEVRLVAHVNRVEAQAVNVTASLPGADAAAPPLVVMTPRSGWYACASERGGGLVCWLDIMRALRAGPRPARRVLFVASSGHELGHLGINAYVDRRPGIVANSRAWIHLGANIGAAVDPLTTVQASDDESEKRLGDALAAAGLSVDRRIPRGQVPGGEAEVVHHGGGRYVSVIGRSAWFHHPDDRGPSVIDAAAMARFSNAFIAVARALATT